MKNRLVLFVVGAIMLGSLTTGCNRLTRVMPENTPGAVVKAAVMAGNNGKYSEVEMYLSTDCVKFFESDLGHKAGGIRGMVDRDTRNGTVTKIMVVKENMIGEAAEVISVFHYKDGNTRVDHTKMIKENGVWRISCS